MKKKYTIEKRKKKKKTLDKSNYSDESSCSIAREKKYNARKKEQQYMY